MRRIRMTNTSDVNVMQAKMSRSFYVGENMKEEDIHAKYENGILTLTFRKNRRKLLEKTLHCN